MASSAGAQAALQRSNGNGREDLQGGGRTYSESTICTFKKLHGDLHLMEHNVEECETGLRFLKTKKKILKTSINQKKALLATGHSSSLLKTKSQNLSQSENGNETTEQILRHENSAAGLFCQMQIQYIAETSHLTLTKDVLGIVASLGTVDDDNLSRLFSEYLGLETMLAIVCKTYEGIKAVEMYDKEGCINRSSGLHGVGNSIGKKLDGRFLVICLEFLRPYTGEFVADDPQRRLDLPKPCLPNGECPSGFLGFAVNMINLDTCNLNYVTAFGCGLRETLFYHLFSRIQVYRTRSDMMNALSCLSDGAFSLDGGMMKTGAVFCLGNQKDVDLRFGVGSRISNLPLNIMETEKQIQMMIWERVKLEDAIKRGESLLGQAKINFELKNKELAKFVSENSLNMIQIPGGQNGLTPI